MAPRSEFSSDSILSLGLNSNQKQVPKKRFILVPKKRFISVPKYPKSVLYLYPSFLLFATWGSKNFLLLFLYVLYICFVYIYLFVLFYIYRDMYI